MSDLANLGKVIKLIKAVYERPSLFYKTIEL